MKQKVIKCDMIPPYKAALVFSNDCDCVTWQAFLETHIFLNTRLEISGCQGIGLPIDDSFWAYLGPFAIKGMSYFEGTTNKRSRIADYLDVLIRSGLLTTLHTWGDFLRGGTFHRGLAIKAVEEFVSRGLTIPVWTNHGDIHNFQNLKSKFYKLALGNVSKVFTAGGFWYESVQYHADLLKSIGAQYIWDGYLSDVVGQDRPAYALSEAFHGRRPPYRKGKKVKELYGIKRFAKGVLRYGFTGALKWPNELLETIEVIPSYECERFVRYGFWGFELGYQLPDYITEDVLDRLESVGGKMCIYTHFFIRNKENPTFFSDRAVSFWRRLSDRHNRQSLRVMRLVDLLDLALLHKRMKWSSQIEGSLIKISVTTTDSSNPPLKNLAGLCFQIPKDLTPQLWVDEREIPISTLNWVGQRYIYVPYVEHDWTDVLFDISRIKPQFD